MCCVKGRFSSMLYSLSDWAYCTLITIEYALTIVLTFLYIRTTNKILKSFENFINSVSFNKNFIKNSIFEKLPTEFTLNDIYFCIDYLLLLICFSILKWIIHIIFRTIKQYLTKTNTLTYICELENVEVSTLFCF